MFPIFYPNLVQNDIFFEYGGSIFLENFDTHFFLFLYLVCTFLFDYTVVQLRHSQNITITTTLFMEARFYLFIYMMQYNISLNGAVVLL